MKKTVFLPFLALSFLGCTEGGAKIAVEPGGRISSPRAARDELRKLRKENGGKLPKGGVVVEFAKGTYALPETLVLGAEDSGERGSPVVWKAKEKGTAVFSGAVELDSWKTAEDPAVLSKLPGVAKGKVLETSFPEGWEIPDFHGGSEECYSKRLNFPLGLYQGSKRLPLARYPDMPASEKSEESGYVKTGPLTDGKQGAKFKFENPRLESWAKEDWLWVYGMFLHEYADMKMAVKEIDPGNKTIKLDNRWYPRGFKEDAPFYAFNALCELDRPGEWVVDRAKRKIYLWPLEDVAKCPPAVGKTMSLVAATNISNVVFEGICFEYSRRDAIVVSGSENVALRALSVSHTGAWGVTVDGGEGVKVEGCDLTDLGEGGIRLAGGNRETLSPGRHVADNNHISHYGKVIPSYRPGVSLSGTGNCATHNLIHHTRHQGIWFNGNDHYIAFNTIHDTCLFNDDAGAIYCCQRDWTKRGTLIEGNVVFATGKQPHRTSTDAIYLDDYSSGNTVRGNFVSGATYGVHIGGGNGNAVYSNVFAECEISVNLGSRRGAHFGGVHEKGRKSLLLKRLLDNSEKYSSPPWSEKYPVLKELMGFSDVFRVHDPVFNRIEDNVYASSGNISNPLAKDVEAYSVISGNVECAASGAFKRYGYGDFAPANGSVLAETIGERPLYLKAGLYDSPFRASGAVKFGEDATLKGDETPMRPFAKPVVRIDIAVRDLPAGVETLGTQCVNSFHLPSQKGKRIVAKMGTAERDWTRYSFSFVPTHDANVVFLVSGDFGMKVEYDSFAVEGFELADPSFDLPAGKSPWRAVTGSAAGMRGDNGKPYGVVDGRGIANHVRQISQNVRLKKGVPVKVSFSARGFFGEK